MTVYININSGEDITNCEGYYVINNLNVTETQHDSLSDALKNRVMFNSTRNPICNILYINARSMRNKFDFIKCIIDQVEIPHIIVISEIWLKEGEMKYYNIPGYNSFFALKTTSIGGGVAIYVLTEYDCIEIHKIQSMHSILHLRLRLVSGDIHLLGVYNPNVTNGRKFLKDLEVSLTYSYGKNCLLIGDTNINLHATLNAIALDYIELMLTYNLRLANNKFPTRLDNNNSLLDHFFTNKVTISYNIYNIMTDLSDHNLLIVDLHNANIIGAKNIVEKNTSYKFKKINFNSLRKFFKENQITVDEVNVNEITNSFLCWVDEGVTKYTKEKITLKNKIKIQPWVNKELLELIRKKEKLYAKIKKPGISAELRCDYRALCNFITSKKRVLKKVYYDNKIESSKNETFGLWQIVREILTVNKTKNIDKIGSLIFKDNIYNSSEDISNCFNNYFTSVAQDLDNNISKVENDLEATNICTRSMFLTPVTDMEIINYIHELKPGHANNGDQVSSNLLKYCHEYFRTPLKQIINSSFEQGIVPDKLKIARVVPIHKGDDKKQPNNWRPISILSGVSKVLEKAMKARITKFLNANKFFHKNQYGFINNSSTTSALSDMIHHLQSSLDRGMIAGALFIDLCKAFDTVNHNLLLQKLENAGIRGRVLKWFLSYLSNRRQYVDYCNSSSQIRKIKFGVPQGSILGPLLFLIFINDIFQLKLKGKIMLFADDCGVFYEANTSDEVSLMIQEDLILLKKWFDVNRLTMNFKKTNYMFFHRKIDNIFCPEIPIEINNYLINRVYQTKYLGLYLDTNLSWVTHIDYLRKKLSSVVGVLNRLRKVVDYKSLKSIYYALAYSHLKYADIIWSCCTQDKLNSLSIIQNKIIRALYGFSYDTSRYTMYKEAQLLPLKETIQMSLIIYGYQILNNSMHTANVIEVKRNENIHNYKTRTASSLHLHSVNTSTYGLNSLKYRAIKAYNEISVSLKNVSNISLLKKKLKKHFLNKYSNI